MCRVRCRSFWLGIIALLGTVGCSGDSAPPVLAIRAPVAEQPILAEPEFRPTPVESVAPRTIAPQRSAVFIPDTPDGTVRAVFQGLRDGHPEVVWDALPASYQRDLNELVHLAASRLNPEAWRWAQKIAGKSAQLAKASLHAAPSRYDFADADGSIELNMRTLETLAPLLDGISKCGLEPLERSKTVDLGDVLRTDGRTLVPAIFNIVGLLDGDFPEALKRWLQQDSVSIQEIAGDSAFIEIESPQTNRTMTEFVRVEGKWIPRWLADEWESAMEAARKAIREALPSEIANDNFGSPFQALASIDMQVDELLRQIKRQDTEPDSVSDEFSVFDALMMLGYWIGGPPAIEPDFDMKLKKETLKGKNKVTLVYCYASKELKFRNESVDYDLAKQVASQLSAHEIKVVDPDQVYEWLDKNRLWKKPSEIGAAFKCDYMIHIDLIDFSVLEPGSTSLNRGRADCIVNVIKMDVDKTDGSVIYTRPIKSIFPSGGPIDSSAMPPSAFKKPYLSFLSDEIGQLFYSTSPDDDFPTAADYGR